jgi:hypothetical protein
MFLPYIVTLRGLTEFAKEIALLFVDDCSVHITDDVIRLLTDARVRVITCASHTIHVFQVLHLTFFDVLKRRPRNQLLVWDNNAMV